MSKKYILTVPDDFQFTEGYGQYLSVEPYTGDKYKHALDILCGMSLRNFTRVFGQNLCGLGLDADEITEMLFSFDKTEKQVQEKINSIVSEIGIEALYEYVKDRRDCGEE